MFKMEVQINGAGGGTRQAPSFHSAEPPRGRANGVTEVPLEVYSSTYQHGTSMALYGFLWLSLATTRATTATFFFVLVS